MEADTTLKITLKQQFYMVLIMQFLVHLLIIADGLKGENWQNIEIKQKHFKNVKIAGDIQSADSMIVMSHFKGHEMAGFGGAIKNLAMGCAAAPGKIEQHECVKPVILNGCTSCGTCIESCPENCHVIR